MKTLSEYIDSELKFVSTSFFCLDYNLVAGNEVVASLSCERNFAMNGIVNGLGKNIEFYKESFWKWETCIREIGKENYFAVCKKETGFCTYIIELPQGVSARIKLGFFYLTVTIENYNGNTLVVLKRPNIFSRSINVIQKEKSVLLDENPWIIFLALYLSIKGMMRKT